MTCVKAHAFIPHMSWTWNPLLSLCFLWNRWPFTAISPTLSKCLDTYSTFASFAFFSSDNFLRCLRWPLKTTFKFVRLWNWYFGINIWFVIFLILNDNYDIIQDLSSSEVHYIAEIDNSIGSILQDNFILEMQINE